MTTGRSSSKYKPSSGGRKKKPDYDGEEKLMKKKTKRTKMLQRSAEAAARKKKTNILQGTFVVLCMLMIETFYKSMETASTMKAAVQTVMDYPTYFNTNSNNNDNVSINIQTNENSSSSSSSATTIAAMNTNNNNINATPPFYFAACLQIKDDNIIIPEWIAFHYTTLPLRRLIIALDPFNTISPNHVKKQYEKLTSSITNANINSTINPNSFLNISIWQLKGKRKSHEAHRQRQPKFFQRCLQTLQKEKKWTWTLFIDSDEYLTINKFNPMLEYNECLERRQESTRSNHRCTMFLNKWKEEREKLPTLGKDVSNTTIAHIIDNHIRNDKISSSSNYNTTNNNNHVTVNNAYVNNTNTNNNVSTSSSSSSSSSVSLFEQHHCLYIKQRIIYGPMKSTYEEISKNVPTSIFNPYNFKTLRDRYHDGLHRYDTLSKSIVDVSRYDGHTRPIGPHRILPNNCPGLEPPLFRVQHYTGTKKEFLFRTGSFRSTKLFKKRSKFQPMNSLNASTYKVYAMYENMNNVDGNITGNNENSISSSGGDDDSRYWLLQFIQLVGNITVAYELTEGLQSLAKEQYAQYRN